MFVPFPGDDPVRFVIAANIQRRHLNESQRSILAAKLATLRVGEKPTSEPNAPIGASQTQAASMLNVGRRSVQRARQVLERATPEDVAAISKGKATVSGVAKKLKPTRPKSKKPKKPTPPVSSKSKPQTQPEPKRDAEGPLETGAVDAPAEMMIARLDLVVAENRALLVYINNHAPDIDQHVAVAAAKAARISRCVHERVRTLAATNRNRAGARRQNAADPKDDEH